MTPAPARATFHTSEEVNIVKVLLTIVVGMLAAVLALPVVIVVGIALGPAALVLGFIAFFTAVVAFFARPRASR